MKLQNSYSQPDPLVSFLDVIFCLVVFLVLILCVSKVTEEEVQKESEIKSQKVEVANKPAEEGKKVNATRFRGRGGQPYLNLQIGYRKGEGAWFKIAGHEFDWFGFRKLICNLDRREAGAQPAMLFKLSYDRSYSVSVEDLMKDFGDFVTREEIESLKSKDKNNYIVNLHKKVYPELEIALRKFKVKYTTEDLGNWDVDEVGRREYSKYEVRKQLGAPYLWFSVDNSKKKVMLGSRNDPLLVDADVFVDVIASIKGGDGFYIEYRSSETLRYEADEEIPDWVVKSVIEPLGFSSIVSQGS